MYADKLRFGAFGSLVSIVHPPGYAQSLPFFLRSPVLALVLRVLTSLAMVAVVSRALSGRSIEACDNQLSTLRALGGKQHQVLIIMPMRLAQHWPAWSATHDQHARLCCNTQEMTREITHETVHSCQVMRATRIPSTEHTQYPSFESPNQQPLSSQDPRHE